MWPARLVRPLSAEIDKDQNKTECTDGPDGLAGHLSLDQASPFELALIIQTGPIRTAENSKH